MSEHSCVSFPFASYILIERPGWYDAEFYGKWLLAATETQRLCDEAVNTDCKFRAKTARIELSWRDPFGAYALTLIRCLAISGRTEVIGTHTDLAQGVAMMAHMGFFVLTGERYQMVLPPPLNSEAVRAAALKLLEAFTGNSMQLESIVRTMPFATAQRWRQELEEMDEGQRLADRKLLLRGLA